MPSSLRPGTGQLSLIRLALAVVVACASLALTALVRAETAHAICGGSSVLTGSCFEGGDGNLSADGGLLFSDNVDWATVGDELLFNDPSSPGTQFVNTSDEQDPTSWSLTTGEPSSNKLDITAAATRIERIGSEIWMHVGFTMQGAAGSANVLVELNRQPAPAGTNPLPVRSADDALIQFTGNANQAARIGLCQWVGNQFGQGSGGSNSYGWYTTPLPGSLITSNNKDCTQISGGGNPTAIGKVNQSVVLNNLKDETQLVTATGPNAGTFTLTFNGQTTAAIARNATAATVQSALVALSNIGPTDVSVTASAAGGPFTVRFQGAYAATDVAQMTGAGSALESISTLGQGGSSNYLASPPFPAPTIAADIFGEMSINLTQSLGAGGANPCFNFGSVWLHTYNGNSISSIMADYVKPQSLLGASSCSVSVDKKVAVNQDSVNAPANAGDYHEGTPADPSTAQVGDYLWYRLAVTNSGTVALTPNVTDANCDLPANPTPVEKRNASYVADATPGSFDAGDVWTYLCKHQLAAGDSEPYVNTVKATGTNGSFTTPEAQDSASTTSNGSLVVKKDFSGPFEAAHRVNLLVGGVVKAAAVGDDGVTPAQAVEGGSSVSFGETFTVGAASQYASSAVCVDTKGTAAAGDDTPVSSTFDAGTLSGSVTVAGRKAILCTITNARRTGTIKVVKNLVPASDAGRFLLDIDGVVRDVATGPGTGATNFADGSQSAAITVATGASHSVAEAGSTSPATSLSDYVSSVSCSKSGGPYIGSTPGTSLSTIGIADGDSVICTFVNTRKGSLTVAKDFTGPFESAHRVNINAAGSQRDVASGGANDGTPNFGDGDDTGAITVDGGSTVSFSEAFVAPATAAQYTGSAVCRDQADQLLTDAFTDAALTGSVTIAPGADVTCTITNQRRTGTIKVVKQIVPVDGQLGDPGLFDLQIDGATERADAADGDTTGFVTKPTGSHTVGELAGTGTDLADYDASVVCTDQAQSSVAAVGDESPWTLALAAGADVTCEITNVRKKGSVKLIKDIVPVDEAAGDTGRFDLHIDGEGAYDADRDEAGDGDSVELTVPNGAVDLSETADGETSLGDYLTAFACENTAVGNTDDPVIGGGTSIEDLAVSAGDAWVCTLTNTRKQGTVTLVKDIVPVDVQLGDPGKFDLSIDAGDGYSAGRDEAGDDDSVSLTMPTGEADLAETADDETDLADYDTTYACTNLTPDNTDAQVTGSGPVIDGLAVTAGDAWRCVLRNERKQGAVQLTKVIVAVDTVLGDPGRFDLEIDGENAYDESMEDAVNGDSIAINVPNGSVDLSEAGGTATDLADYDSTYRCENVAPGSDDAPVSGSGTAITGLVVTAGDQWQCTFTNTRKRGDVRIVKQIVPVDGQLGDPGRFDLHIDGEGGYDATKDEAGDGDSVQLTVPNGPVDFSESADDETSLADYVSSYICVNAAEGSSDADVTGDGVAVNGLDVTAGDDWTCTFTNTRKQGSVTLVKDIVPVDEQLGDPGKFDLSIDGEGGYDAVKDEAGDGDSVQLTVPNGPVDLSESADDETSLSDYVTTYSCVDEGDEPVNGEGPSIADLPVTAGDDWTCTFTNTRKQASVKLVKDIVPVDEQLGDPGKFDLSIDAEGGYDATKDEAGDGDSVQLTVPNGPVDLSESADDETSLNDYVSAYVCVNEAEGSADQPISGDGASVADLPVTAGDDWTCTFTNTRKQGSVTLVKDIVPVDEQLGDPGKFDLSIDGEGGYDASKDEAGDGDSVSRTVPNGTVDLSESADEETSLSDYVTTYSCVNEGDDPVNGEGPSIADLPVTAGDDWTCTFTNTRKQASVKLVKDIVPVDEQLGDPGKFDLSIDGEGSYDADKDEAGDGDFTEVSLPNGSVDLSETADGETTLADYVTTYRCENSAEGDQDDPLSGDGPTISDLTVTTGDRWTCTLRNERKSGHVKLVKDIVPVDAQLGDPGKFNLAIDGEGGYDAATPDAGDGGFAELTVPTGAVDLSESAGSDTALSDYITTYTCVNEGDDPVSGDGIAIDDLAVEHGDDWTCTLRNERKQGNVQLTKVIVAVDGNLGDPGRFDLEIDGEGGYDESMDDAVNGGSIAIDVPNGRVDLSESAGMATNLGDYTSTYECVNAAEGNTDAAVSGAGTSITNLVVSEGDLWACTFTNTRKKGEVKLVKDIVPVTGEFGDPGRFDLLIDGEGDYDATKDEAGDGDSVERTVPNGSVDLSESADDETSLNDYVTTYRCVNAAGEGSDPLTGDGTSIADLPVDQGDDWTCTFTNTRKEGVVRLVKDIVPVDEQLGDPGKFDLLIDGEGDYDATKNEAGDGDFVELAAPNGTVDLSESADGETSLGDYTTTYSCENLRPGNEDPSVSGDGTSISDLHVSSSDLWSCTFTNTRKQGSVTLVKDIVPVDNELGDPGKFDLLIDGEGSYDASKDEAGDNDLIQRTVPNGLVDLSESADGETSLGDYTTTYACVNSTQDSGDQPVSGDGTSITDLPVSAGDDWRCVLRNERKPGTVTVGKVIVAVDPALGDPGKFDLSIDGEGDYDKTLENAVNGGSTSLIVPGGAVDLSEAAGDGTSLADYSSTYQCANSADGSEDAPVNGQGTSVAGLIVKPGDVWTCIFTNTRNKGHVKLVKDVVPVDEQLGDPGNFDLAIDGEGSYDASKNEAGDGDFVERDVPNGTVDLSESADGETSLSDYTSTYSCTNDGDDPVNGTGTSINDLPVNAGDDWTCTLRNERKKGKVTVVKQLDPVSDSGLFDLSINGPLGYDKTASDRGHGGSVTIDVPTGTVDVAEAAGTGTTLGAYISTHRCENVAQGSEDAPISGGGASVSNVSVTAGDDWVCAFTNVRKPRIVVKKLTDPAGDEVTAFPFTANLPATTAGDGSQEIAGGGAFTLKHGQQVQALVAPGSYWVTEADVYALNYKLKSAVCEETIPNDDRFDLASNEQSDNERTRSFTADAGDVITCTFVNEKLTGIQVVAKTPKSQSVYIDQNVSYQYEVTNTGTADLTDVTVADDKCPGPATRQADAVGDGDAILEPGEKWIYTCTVAASAIFTGDATQVTNTVTVNAKDQAGKPTAPSTDTAVTNLLKQAIAIDKTGPATATAGDLLTYTLAVTNTGNTVFSDGMVVLTDALCQAPPALLSKNGDGSPETLSPGETWTYSCQVQTQAGQQTVDNSGSVTGTDQGGRNATATDTASTALSQPATQALPNVTVTRTPGSARLRGTVGCATASYARATISGKQIKSVTYYVNGKKLRTLTKPTSGSSYSMRVKVRSLEYGTHRVTARVVFVAAARTNAKTLRLQFSRCRPRVVQPKFTG